MFWTVLGTGSYAISWASFLLALVDMGKEQGNGCDNSDSRTP